MMPAIPSLPEICQFLFLSGGGVDRVEAGAEEDGAEKWLENHAGVFIGK